MVIARCTGFRASLIVECGTHNAEIHGAAAETASTVETRDRRLPCNFLFAGSV